MLNIRIAAPIILFASCTAHARPWNNTGTGSIVFEEAWTVPALSAQNACVNASSRLSSLLSTSSSKVVPPLGTPLNLRFDIIIVIILSLPLGQTNAELLSNLLDIHDQRLSDMDETGVDFVCTHPLSISHSANIV